MARSINRLLADFGHELPTKPQPDEARPVREFTSAPPWRGKPVRGAGWVASRPAVKRYRMTSDQAGVFWPFLTASSLPPTGAPMGTDMSNGTTFYVDPHGWVLNDAIPVTNPNWTVPGLVDTGEVCGSR